MRRHAGDAEARTVDEARVVRQFGYEIGVECDVFGGGTEEPSTALPVVEPDAPPEPCRIDTGADFVDEDEEPEEPALAPEEEAEDEPKTKGKAKGKAKKVEEDEDEDDEDLDDLDDE